jgi:glucose/arabinose dehydrogenase
MSRIPGMSFLDAGRVAAGLVTAALLATCFPGDAAAQQTKAPAAPATAVSVEVVARGLEHPWALQFLPDGRMIVSERPGRLRIVTRQGEISPPLAGLPPIAATGQGGLLDVALARDFPTTGTIYFTFAEPRGSGGQNGTSLARARLDMTPGAGRLLDVRTIFRQEPATRGGLHFGSRIAIADDGRLFVTLGERYQMDFAQALGRHWGKVVRLEPDGTAPADNPFVGTAGARGEIWSYGHRNPQAAAIHPVTRRLWIVEHGPRGGDEVNVIKRGANYGWPVIGYGIDYSGAVLHQSTHKPGMEQPAYYWAPSIAPSGMAFYTGDLFPRWRGNLLVGALAGTALHRLVLDGEAVIAEEVLLKERGERIRDVRQGPDGAIWLLVDAGEGSILRLGPAS